MYSVASNGFERLLMVGMMKDDKPVLLGHSVFNLEEMIFCKGGNYRSSEYNVFPSLHSTKYIDENG